MAPTLVPNFLPWGGWTTILHHQTIHVGSQKSSLAGRTTMRQLLESMRKLRTQKSAPRKPPSRPSSATPAAPPSHPHIPILNQSGPNDPVSASRPPSNCEEPGVNGEASPGSCGDPPTSLWDRAYDALRESDQSLVGRYEELLSRELQTTGSSAIFSPWSLLPHKAPAAANPSSLKRRWDLRSSRRCD